MTDPKTEARIAPQTETKFIMSQANMRIYQKEVRVVVVSCLIVMLVAMGVFFMLPFPELLDVYIWGYPFPYWYQMTIAYVGVIVFVYFIINVLNKLDKEKESAEREVEG